jgi:hypothetical protein
VRRSSIVSQYSRKPACAGFSIVVNGPGHPAPLVLPRG